MLSEWWKEKTCSNLNPYFLFTHESVSLFVVSKISIPFRSRTCALNYLLIFLAITWCSHEAVRCCCGKYLLTLIPAAVFGIIIFVAIKDVFVVLVVHKSTSHSYWLTFPPCIVVYLQCLLVLMDFSNTFTSQHW